MAYAIIMHTVCGGPAFKYDHMPAAGEKIDRSKITTMGGKRVPVSATGMACGNCRLRLTAPELAPGLMVYDATNEEDMDTFYGGKRDDRSRTKEERDQP